MQYDDAAVFKPENFLRVKNIPGAEEFVSQSFADIQHTALCAVRLSVTSWPPLAMQVVASKRAHFRPVQTSSGDRVAGMVAE